MSGSSRRGHHVQLSGNKAFLALAPCRTADDRSGSVYKLPRRLAMSAFWIFTAFYVLACAVTWVMYVCRPVSVGIDERAPVADLARA